MVPSAGADEAWQAEFLKFQHQIAIREVPQPIDSLAFSSDGGSIVSGTHDGRIQLWNAQTAEPMGPAWAGHGPISSIAFGPGAARIVSGTPDGSLQQWNLDTRQLLPADPFMPAPWFNWSVAISRDGDRSPGREMGDVVLWNLAEEADRTPGRHSGSVGPASLSFAPMGSVSRTRTRGGRRARVVIHPRRTRWFGRSAGADRKAGRCWIGVRSGVCGVQSDGTVSSRARQASCGGGPATGRAVLPPKED
jgi:hypothetical protein